MEERLQSYEMTEAEFFGEFHTWSEADREALERGELVEFEA